jgi:hypothetical protein
MSTGVIKELGYEDWVRSGLGLYEDWGFFKDWGSYESRDCMRTGMYEDWG